MATELDRQVEDYKRRADAGETISRSDALWLLNELIYERDQKAKAARRDKRTKKPESVDAVGQPTENPT